MKTHTRVCVRGRRPKNEIIISVDSDRRPFFPQCLVYASSGKLRGSGVPAREGHSLEKRIARDLRRRQRKPIRNAGKRVREEIKRRERERGIEKKDRSRYILKDYVRPGGTLRPLFARSSIVHRKSGNCSAELMPLLTNKQINSRKNIIIQNYRL